MTSIVRFIEVTNPTAAILTSALANAGDDLAAEIVRRVFAADDIGAGAGQTQDATDPTVGCLVAQFTGSRVVDVMITLPYRTVAATNSDFRTAIVGTADNTASLGYRVSYNDKTGVSSIYVLDTAADADGQIVEDDWIYIIAYLGTSPSITPLG